MSERLRRLKRYIVLRLLHADDTPHEISLGAAIGVFIAMTPTIGVQMMLALVTTTALRANKAVSVAMVWISNPLTMVPIFFFNWQVGRSLVRTADVAGDSAVRDKLREIIDSIGGMTNLAAHIFDGEFWSQVLRLVWELGVELWIGSFLVGGVSAVVGYILCFIGIRFYRSRFPRPRFIRRKPQGQRSNLRTSRPRLQKESA
jgi:hypothetical protein